MQFEHCLFAPAFRKRRKNCVKIMQCICAITNVAHDGPGNIRYSSCILYDRHISARLPYH